MVKQGKSENMETESNTTQETRSGDQRSSSNGQGAWGYDMYPERKNVFRPSLTKVMQMKQGREYYDKLKCEENVYDCIKNSPLVKLMTSALRSSGW